MKKEEFVEIFGDINESYIKEAEAASKARKSAWFKWGAVAACLCLVVIGFWQRNTGDSPDTDTGGGIGGIMPGGVFIEAEDSGDRDGESYQEAVKVPLPVGTVETGERDTEFEDAPSMIVDANAPNMDGVYSFETIWGGTYLDENSCWVVWLTENTPERQAEVFQRNPSLPEDSTIFRTADFSLAYLNELLANISEGMRDGKLPFVTSAAVMESTNRVEVSMTTENEEAINQIRTFDVLGGAIKFRFVDFHFVTGNTTDNLASAE